MWRDALASLLCVCRLIGRLLIVAVQEVLHASMHNQAQWWCEPGLPPDQEIILPSYPGRCSPEKGFWGSGRCDKLRSHNRDLKRKNRWYMAECDINHSVMKKSRSDPRKTMWRFKFPLSDELDNMIGEHVPSCQTSLAPPRKFPLPKPLETPTFTVRSCQSPRPQS
ncbi:unnamed protein product [Linum trigynum]|uniref:Uncharacterized protein n=1 Tax=Linum trigynum TaxID=586398 RepID=A0AAV2CV69_9ROSI